MSSEDSSGESQRLKELFVYLTLVGAYCIVVGFVELALSPFRRLRGVISRG